MGKLPVCAEKLSEVAEMETCPWGGSLGPDGDELFEHDRTAQITTASTQLGQRLSRALRLNAPLIIIDVNSRILYARLRLAPLQPGYPPEKR
jgi:hypothetical protein